MEFNGVAYLLELGLQVDLALVKPGRRIATAILFTPRQSCLQTDGTQLQSNRGYLRRVTVAEAEIVVEAGEIDPDHIHTPGIFVQRGIHNPNFERRIERRTVRKE